MTAPLYTPNSYAATGVAGSYAYGFRILDQTHLMATLNGVALVLGADYTVDGVGASAGGNLIPVTPAAIVGTLVLSRNVPYTRTTDFQDDFRPLTFNNDQDTQTMQAQQLADAAARSMSLPVGTTGVNVTLPVPGAGKFFRYNAGGTAIEVVDLAATLGSAVASAFGLTLMQSASAPAGTDVLFGAVISPAQIVANTDNYAPAGLATASMLRINTDAARNLTGITAPADRRLMTLHNIGAFPITLKDDTTSVAANRFQLNGDYTLAADASVVLQYDVTSARWRVFGQQAAGAQGFMGLTAAVNANALTVTLAAGTVLNFNDGTSVTLGAAISVTVPAGQAMGTVNGQRSRLWAVAVKNGGAPELALFNALSGTSIAAIPLGGSISTTAIAAAPSAQIFYSTNARAAQPFCVTGYVESTQAAAGTWASAPTAQGYGPGVPLPGTLVQQVGNVTGALATGTTQIPNDDTIPQNTEGDQYMTQAITPTSAANLLEVTAKLNCESGGAPNNLTYALFQDATANALSACAATVAGNEFPIPNPLTHLMVAGGTAATTFKMRAGASTAGTTTFNGTVAARKFGGVNNSYMLVREIAA